MAPSLQKAGFTEWSSGLFAESERGVTVELREELGITVDGHSVETFRPFLVFAVVGVEKVLGFSRTFCVGDRFQCTSKHAVCSGYEWHR